MSNTSCFRFVLLPCNSTNGSAIALDWWSQGPRRACFSKSVLKRAVNSLKAAPLGNSRAERSSRGITFRMRMQYSFILGVGFQSGFDGGGQGAACLRFTARLRL